ncbi:DUF547 domain-containing protein [uncultured Algibacter sp.]|uniref:DUF547 domain-containing protein n=1 Tax=uncultured Algibacter sp. TaxID=298659 RepID=UPI00261949DA|nr:DUF547 domain-containing protein [uncultured Algibacter sp.]
MRILLIFIVFISFFSACCGTKTVVKNVPKPFTKNELQIEEKNNVADIDSTKAIKENPILPETEEIIAVDKTTVNKTEISNHSSYNALLYKYVSNEGNVNYDALKKDDAKSLRDYIVSLGKNLPNESWSKEEKLAFWINAYNALTIDLILRNYPINSIKDIKDPWDQRLWKFGKKWYNLNDIEHQILRKMNEPRIHFAIVCASFSCPKLQNEAFTAINLEKQLTSATKEFLNDSKRNQIGANSIKLSKIFQWFAKDFKQDGSLIVFLNLYSDIKISPNAKKRFMDYNWNLNE